MKLIHILIVAAVAAVSAVQAHTAPASGAGQSAQATMTMVFPVADPKMLDTLKEGDTVKFTAEKVNGTLNVTSIQAAK